MLVLQGRRGNQASPDTRGCAPLRSTPPVGYQVQVTNPPFSLKFKWLERAYEIGEPFAFLLPINTLGTVTAQKMFEKHGISVLLLDKRIDFKMPFKGWEGGGAQFSTAWFMWKLADPGLYYGKITNKPKKETRKKVDEEV